MKKQNNKSQRNGLPAKEQRWHWMAGAAASTVAGLTAAQAANVTVPLTGNYISESAGNHLNPDLTGDGHANITLANIVSNSSLSTIGTYTTTTQTTTQTSTQTQTQTHPTSHFTHTTSVVNPHPTSGGGTTFTTSHPVISSTFTFTHTFTHTNFHTHTNTNTNNNKSYKNHIRVAVDIDGKTAFAQFSFNTRTTSNYSSSAGVSSSSTNSGEPSTITKSIAILFSGDPAINNGLNTPGTLSVEAIANGASDVEVQLLSYSYNQITLTPYQTLQAVKAELNGLLSSHNSAKVQAALKQAIADINLSLAASNWQKGFLALNPTKGLNTFNANALAIQALTALAKTGGVTSPVAAGANAAIGSIAQADIQLATAALQADKGKGVITLLHQATKDLALANVAFAAKNYAAANTDAFNAFQLAVEAK